MAELATLTVERTGDLHVARIAGEVDISNAATLGEGIASEASNDAAGLVLDLTPTSYLDSAGIRLLFELKQRLADRRQTLAVVVPEDSLIRSALLITEVDQAIELHGELDSALASLRAVERPAR